LVEKNVSLHSTWSGRRIIVSKPSPTMPKFTTLVVVALSDEADEPVVVAVVVVVVVGVVRLSVGIAVVNKVVVVAVAAAVSISASAVAVVVVVVVRLPPPLFPPINGKNPPSKNWPIMPNRRVVVDGVVVVIAAVVCPDVVVVVCPDVVVVVCLDVVIVVCPGVVLVVVVGLLVAVLLVVVVILVVGLLVVGRMVDVLLVVLVGILVVGLLVGLVEGLSTISAKSFRGVSSANPKKDVPINCCFHQSVKYLLFTFIIATY